MTKLVWGTAGTRYFDTGLDRGVLYMKRMEYSDATLALTTGSKNFSFLAAVPAPFPVGAILKFVNRDATAQFMQGTVTAVSAGTTVNITSVTGSGSSSNWLITRVDNAVSWSGLTGVDENGADSSTPMYLDGRPYLNKPNPKEYSATIKAITYPDEFNRAQGLVEAYDGMYLDSQQAEAFDFSYRTLVGNDVKGPDLGYKIHLIYNATATPSSISNVPVTNQVTPTEFSWDIETVPVPYTNFRSMAHITVDTRKLSTAKVSALEDLLYGTVSNYARMPTPSQVRTALAS